MLNAHSVKEGPTAEGIFSYGFPNTRTDSAQCCSKEGMALTLSHLPWETGGKNPWPPGHIRVISRPMNLTSTQFG